MISGQLLAGHAVDASMPHGSHSVGLFCYWGNTKANAIA
jgi:hypothetical protein